jgi:hypothetical protein
MSVAEKKAVLERELQWRKASKDPVFFLEHFWHIRVPGKGAVPMKLRQAQKDGLAHWRDNRFSLTLKARQIGWTTLVSGYQFWLCFFTDHIEVIDVSRNEDEAKQIIRKTKLGYDLLPNWMRERGPGLAKDNREELEFTNGSRIVSKPSRENPARGSSADLVVVDEWAFLPNPEEAWASIEPVADAGGSIIGLSTANGGGNFFHELWVGAQTKNSRFVPMFHPWSASETRDQAWYEQKRRELPSWQLAQEYPTTAEEAFVRSGNPVFDPDVLATQRSYLRVPKHVGFLHEVTSVRNVELRPADGPLSVWELPTVGELYTIGADTSEGLEHGDYSSAHVIKHSTGDVVAHWHGHVDPDLFGVELAKLGWWYNTALVAPESNNHGVSVIGSLRRLSYPRIYRQKRLNTTNNAWAMEWGWKTTARTKPELINRIVSSLREGELFVVDEATLAELRTYRRDERGRMSGSPFDDRVVSLALAEYARDRVHDPIIQAPADDYLTLDWWAQQGVEQDGDWVIGGHLSRMG